MLIEMSGYAAVRADAQTVGDLRTLLQFLDDNKVADTAAIDWDKSTGHLYVVAADQAAASFIECGEHVPPDLHFDVILNTHDHEQDKTVAMFDWPARDKKSKYNDPSMPG